MKSRGSGMVGYDVQTAVDVDTHLIVAHEVTNVGIDRHQLHNMAMQAKATLEAEHLDVLAYNMKRVIILVGTKNLIQAQ